MMVILENKLDALVRLHTPWAPGLIGHPHQYDLPANLSPESLSGPNAGLTEVLIPAGYVTTTYDPVFRLSEDRKRYVSAPSHVPTKLAEPGLPFSLVFRCEPGKEDIILKIASAYEAASQRRIPPSTIASTIARSRCVRNAASSASTSPGMRTRGRVRVERTSGTPCRGRCRSRLVGKPRGTGLTATSPRACK